MASPGVLSASNAIHQRQPARLPIPSLRQHLIEARLTVEGRVFRTLIREGATVNELIEQVARENGGSVEKKYYPEFKTYEITRVRIGDVLLVKGAKGIHFGLGEFGIPFASAGEQIVFPNADELRVSRETSTIGLWMTSDNFDPTKKTDFDPRYAGGARVSGAAREELEKSHGGMRSEKLLLHDNILVIDRETGEISTVSEYAAKAEGFASPQFQTPTYTSVGLTLASDRGVLALPMDGSVTRVPYLFVKTFDGKITDHLSIQFNPLKTDNPCLKLKEKTGTRSDAPSPYFSALCRQTAVVDSRPAPLQPAPLQGVKTGKRDEPFQQPHSTQSFSPMRITPELIRRYWRHPRLLKEDILRVPISSEPRPAVPSVSEKAGKNKPRRLAEKSERTQEKKKAKPLPKTEAPRRRKRKSPAPSMPLTRKNEGKKPKDARLPRVRAPDVAAKRKKEKRAKLLSSSKTTLKKGAAKLRLHRRSEAVAAAVPKPELLKAKPQRIKAKPSVPATYEKTKRAKKKLSAYFRMELLGLLPKRKRRFSRGRAAARN